MYMKKYIYNIYNIYVTYILVLQVDMKSAQPSIAEAAAAKNATSRIGYTTNTDLITELIIDLLI